MFKEQPISVIIEYVAPRIVDIQISVLGFKFSSSVDHLTDAYYRLVNIYSGVVLATFPSYNQCVHFAEENDYKIDNSAME